MKIYTKTGDSGQTSLFGGQRVWKDDLRISAYGTVDELNSIIGAAVSEIKNAELKVLLNGIQNDLFNIGSDLATPLEKDTKRFSIPRIDEKYTSKIESLIDKYDAELPELKNFILPGGGKGASMLQVARSICRRGEREVVALAKSENVNSFIGIYLNRLSDLLFVLSRFENFTNGTPEPTWQK